MSFKVFAVENNKPLSEQYFNILILSADAEKQQTILKQKIKSNADNSIIGIALAKYALINCYGLKGKELEFFYDEKGKPFLKNKTGIHFNISHSSTMTVCAVSDSPVGIDIEKIRRFNKSMSEKIFGKEETLRIILSENPDLEFTRCWTEKEAILKLTGDGVAKIRKTLTHNLYNSESNIYKDFCISVATYK